MLNISFKINLIHDLLSIVCLYFFLDDENSHVHGVLTSDNLFDGTITTNFEDFYIEPSQKYSNQLHRKGVHTIIYKLSDVKMHFNNSQDKDHSSKHHSLKHNIEHCASEKLYKKLLNDRYNQENSNEKSDKHSFNYIKVNKHKSKKVQFNKSLKRKRRWLPLLDEVRKSIIIIVYVFILFC